jgi:hypothetical protein
LLADLVEEVVDQLAELHGDDVVAAGSHLIVCCHDGVVPRIRLVSGYQVSRPFTGGASLERQGQGRGRLQRCSRALGRWQRECREGREGGGAVERRKGREERLFPYLRWNGYIAPLFIVLGDLTPKQSKLIFQETTERVLIDLDCFLYKQNYLFPNKS